MEGNYIIVDFNGATHISILTKTKEFLEMAKPRGCPFYDYSMFNLLNDWIQMYSWQMERNKKKSTCRVCKENKNRWKTDLQGFNDKYIGIRSDIKPKERTV